MRIILEVDDTTVALSITAMRMYGIETSIGAHCLDIQGADGKVIVIPKDGKAEIKEAAEDAGTEVRHGRWIQRRNGKYYCTNCGREERFIFQKNYCPRCGSDMREVSEDARTAK